MERAEAVLAIVCFPECFLTGYFDRDAPTRRHAFAVDSSRMKQVMAKTKRFDPTLIVGFNERRGRDLYNTALVAHRGKLLGTYSKCTAYMPFHKQGREFPVFKRDGVKFGLVICSDVASAFGSAHGVTRSVSHRLWRVFTGALEQPSWLLILVQTEQRNHECRAVAGPFCQQDRSWASPANRPKSTRRKSSQRTAARLTPHDQAGRASASDELHLISTVGVA